MENRGEPALPHSAVTHIAEPAPSKPEVVARTWVKKWFWSSKFFKRNCRVIRDLLSIWAWWEQIWEEERKSKNMSIWKERGSGLKRNDVPKGSIVIVVSLSIHSWVIPSIYLSYFQRFLIWDVGDNDPMSGGTPLLHNMRGRLRFESIRVTRSQAQVYGSIGMFTLVFRVWTTSRITREADSSLRSCKCCIYDPGGCGIMYLVWIAETTEGDRGGWSWGFRGMSILRLQMHNGRR